MRDTGGVRHLTETSICGWTRAGLGGDAWIGSARRCLVSSIDLRVSTAQTGTTSTPKIQRGVYGQQTTHSSARSDCSWTAVSTGTAVSAPETTRGAMRPGSSALAAVFAAAISIVMKTNFGVTERRNPLRPAMLGSTWSRTTIG